MLQMLSQLSARRFRLPKDEPERYLNSKFHLYPSYCSYCEDTGSKPVGQKRFIALLLDCCANQLGLQNIRQFCKQGRPFVKGLAVRASPTRSSAKFPDDPPGREPENRTGDPSEPPLLRFLQPLE